MCETDTTMTIAYLNNINSANSTNYWKGQNVLRVRENTCIVTSFNILILSNNCLEDTVIFLAC